MRPVYAITVNRARSGAYNRTLTPSRRTTLTVGVAYDTDLEDAQRILADATARADDQRHSMMPDGGSGTG